MPTKKFRTSVIPCYDVYVFQSMSVVVALCSAPGDKFCFIAVYKTKYIALNNIPIKFSVYAITYRTYMKVANFECK